MRREWHGVSSATVRGAILAWLIVVVGGMLIPLSPWQGRCRMATPRCARLQVRLSSQALHVPAASDRDLLLIDWDGGCVVDTVPWRIPVAYHAAALVWPELDERIKAATSAVATATSQQQTSWLTNKLEAVAPVLHEDTRHLSATAQYVLAVRLLLEEQELDQGQSPGTGKYGSLYHPPQRQDKDSENSVYNNASTGSRPLTVNEVSNNWCEFLLDTLPIKYRVRPNQLEEAVKRSIDDFHPIVPSINTGVVSMIAMMAHSEIRMRGEYGSPGTLPIITFRHASELPLIQTWMTQYFKDSQVRVEVLEGIDQLWSPLSDDPTIFILYKQRNTINQILERTESTTDSRSEMEHKLFKLRKVHVVESSWKALQWEISHTDHPIVTDQAIDLKLIAWCPTPEMERRATMCPWSCPCTSALDLEKCTGVQSVAFE